MFSAFAVSGCEDFSTVLSKLRLVALKNACNNMDTRDRNSFAFLKKEFMGEKW